MIVPIYRTDEEQGARARGGAPHRARSLGEWERREPGALARARRRARRHEARREVLRVGAARRSAAHGARPARSRRRTRACSCGATRARRRPSSLDTLGEDGRGAARADPGRHARRARATGARRTACAATSRTTASAR